MSGAVNFNPLAICPKLRMSPDVSGKVLKTEANKIDKNAITLSIADNITIIAYSDSLFLRYYNEENTATNNC